ncbi:MAG: hypothetical protein NC453_15555 [Muribaculum sp.]|nr:hypothetical protein [Muribaculum sp.]
MATKTQELNFKLAQYEYGQHILPAVERIYTNGTSEILSSMSKWSKIDDDDVNNLSSQLDSIFAQNPRLYINAADTLIHVMGELKYFFPNKRDSIDKYNRMLLLSTHTLKELETYKQGVILYDTTRCDMRHRIMSTPEMWVYSDGLDGDNLLELSNLLDSVKNISSELQKLAQECDSVSPEISTNLRSISDNKITTFETPFIKTLNSNYIKNLITLQDIIAENSYSTSWKDHLRFFISWPWLLFIFTIIVGAGVSVIFTSKVFPRKINRNHTTQEYETLSRRLKDVERILNNYERAEKANRDKNKSDEKK